MAEYTRDDLRAADFADWINMWAKINETSVKAEIAGEIREEGITPPAAAEAEELKRTAMYQRGLALLPSVRVVNSERFRAPAGEGQVALDDLKRRYKLVSEPVMVPAGHIATSTAYKWLALAKRS